MASKEQPADQEVERPIALPGKTRLENCQRCRNRVQAAGELFPSTDWQRCVVHFYRNVFSHVPNGKVAEIACMLKAIHAQEDRKAAQAKAAEIAARAEGDEACP